MQSELIGLKSKAKVIGRRRILVPLLDESRGRSATLLKMIASSHVPLISHPAEVARLIEQEAIAAEK